MKTIVPLNQRIVKLVLLAVVLVSGTISQAQTVTPELQFKNSTLASGTAGANGAIYRFPQINASLDALVKINARSSALVTLTSIDITSTGHDKAFQPQISYNNGTTNGSQNWWIEFEISFVTMNTNIPATVNTFDLTMIDDDGDDDKLRENNSFYAPASYVLENNTMITVSPLMQLVLGVMQQVGSTFRGCKNDYSGIDTTTTEIMATMKYNNVNTIKFRAGALTYGASNSTSRMNSFWFKGFSFNAPVINTLPVKLYSFTAALNNNNKVDLKWITTSEINVSHFIVEKSLDGTNFSEAGIVFANGNTSDKTNYTYTDNLGVSASGVIYYRLRSEDFDGKEEFSETRIIRISKQTDKSITILAYPNPVTSELRITIPSDWQNKKVTYELFKSNGQTAKKTEIANSSQTESLNVSMLAPGFYFVRVSCNGEIAHQKLVKL